MLFTNTTTLPLRIEAASKKAAGNQKPRVPQGRAGGLAAGHAAGRAAGHVWMHHKNYRNSENDFIFESDYS
ncbi:unnamed protein product [Parnassius apollo]|uniref:(apollo) hypothetical protein n=1 Tax=Parnassius apollo TaxID=110799 RepID=A0A8S3YE18_PARAO|nr:unnamed protein product [Parnassius apollo]